MTQLTLDLPALVPPRAPLTGIMHVCLPNFSLACGLDFLEKPKGDRVFFGPPRRWADVTCVWCRALGRAWCRRMLLAQQGRLA